MAEDSKVVDLLTELVASNRRLEALVRAQLAADGVEAAEVVCGACGSNQIQAVEKVMGEDTDRVVCRTCGHFTEVSGG